MADPPEVPDAPPGRDPDLQPATQAELRSVRRWLLVTAVWALAATAVALIALLTQDDTAKEESKNATQRISQVERELSARIDALEEDVSSAPQQEDVTRLAQRLSRVENDKSKTEADLKDVQAQADDLESRVEDLESSADAGGDTGAGGDGQNEP